MFFFAGQSTKACELFLKNRAAAVQTAIRQLRIEGATLLYIHKLCNIFFTSLLETAKEFEMDFAGNTGCYSAFVVWSRSAIGMFVDAFSKQVGEGSRPRGSPTLAALKDDESSVEPRQKEFNFIQRCEVTIDDC